MAKHRAIRTPDWKLLYRPTRKGVRWTPLRSGRTIPTSDSDVAAAHPDVAARLRDELRGVDDLRRPHRDARRLRGAAMSRRLGLVLIGLIGCGQPAVCIPDLGMAEAPGAPAS